MFASSSLQSEVQACSRSRRKNFQKLKVFTAETKKVDFCNKCFMVQNVFCEVLKYKLYYITENIRYRMVRGY